LNHLVQYSASALDAVYGALAHSVRRRVLEQLRSGAATVSELAAPYPMTLTAVSKHIRVLETAGLVRRAVEGREHNLTLEPVPLSQAEAWLEGYRSFWETRLDLLDGRIRARRKP
jgi:DNA-binding transcriptional ArsR family regulator